ncbi:MAG: hypothetical protein WCV79_03365 [Candidatus Paceibacterota bacterium]|jgi:ribulose-phosphate 3-epimerase
MEIIPAILPKNFEEIVDKTSSVKGVVKCVQVDICDGQFVTSRTWPYDQRDNVFDRIISENEGLPFWQELDYEFDLMINFRKPEDIEDWIKIGASRIVLHAESKGDLGGMINIIRDQAEVGIALNIETELNVIEVYQGNISFVQLMGIDHIGAQGQNFDPRVLERAREVRAKYPHLGLSIDGGVSIENAAELKAAGVTKLVVGSGIYGADDIVGAIKTLQEVS